MIFSVNGKLLDACVLGLLSGGDTYGYDLTQKIGNYMEVSESTLYPVLRRLSKDGHLTSYDQQHDGRNRKYYQMTDSGKSLLDQYKKDWATHSHTVGALLNGGEEHDER